MVKSRYHKHIKNIKIVQIYPFNNPVSKINTKPVVLAGIPYVIWSSFYNEILIISRYNDSPYNEKILGIKASNKKQYYANIVKLLSTIGSNFIIEVHQDIVLANILAKKFKPKAKVCLFKHGPSLYRSFYDKFKVLRWFLSKIFLVKLDYIYGISNYVTNSLKNKYSNFSYKFFTIYNNYGYINKKDIEAENKKIKRVGFIGKPVKFKGIHIFLTAIKNFLNNTYGWQAILVGAKFSDKYKYKKIIEDGQKNKVKNLIIYNNLSNKEVFLKMKECKVVVIPSVFNEPFGLVALEAHLAECVIVSSGTGALKELSGDYAYYINPLTPESLESILVYIAQNPKEAEEKAKLGKIRALRKFNPQILVEKLDQIRAELLGSY